MKKNNPFYSQNIKLIHPFIVGVISFVILLLFTFISNYNDKIYNNKFVFGIVVFDLLVGFVSLFAFIVVLASTSFEKLRFFLNKKQEGGKRKIKKNFIENRSKTYLLGHFILNLIIAGFASIVSFIIMFPFLKRADGLSFDEKAAIGGDNLWRIVIFYGIFTLLASIYSFKKKQFRTAATIIIVFWLMGSLTVLFISNDNLKKETPNNQNSGNFISSRSSCNKDITLNDAKNCTYRVLRNDNGHGSGFIVSNGYLITNRHVIEGANKLTVWINNQEREVNVWNYSPVIDVAILKLPDDVGNLPTCKWFDSSQLKIAEELYAFGWPNDSGGDSTVTKGIYSRTNNYDDGTEYIQTDAAINPGNSGGSLVNECGVVGVNTSKQAWSNQYTPSEGFGFSLSSNYVHNIINDLIAQGSLAKDIPKAKNYQASNVKPNPNTNTYKLYIEDIRIYLNDIYRAKSSWERARGYVDNNKLNKLMDSFERQIQFSNHLISKLSDGRAASGDDIYMWNSILKMGEESSALTYELNRR